MMPVDAARIFRHASLLLGACFAVFAYGGDAVAKKLAAPALVAPTDGAAKPAVLSPTATDAAASAKVDHEVPPRASKEDDEVPIEWVVSDGRMHRRPHVLSLDVGVWPDTFSLGAFWAAPVLPRGFIRHVNDSLDLEFGLMLGAMRSGWYWRDGVVSWQLWPAFGAKWNFFLTRNWSTFITFKLAGRIGLTGESSGWFDIMAGAGASYRIKERLHLRLEINYPQGAVVGLSMPIGAL